MFRKFILNILKNFDKRDNRCSKCKSKRLNKSFYRRGWNDLCGQATGDSGTRCYDCGHIVWDKSYEEYKNGLPKWCHAYND